MQSPKTCLFPLITVFLTLLLPSFGYSADKHALLISSYHPGFPTFFQQIDGIESELTPAKVPLDVEFMDSKRFNSKESQQKFYELLSDKLHKLSKYDVILTSDDNALKFALKYRNELFPDTPLVFLGVNNLTLGRDLSADPLITGVLEGPSKQETINLAGQLFPQTNAIYILADGTTSSKADLKNMDKQQSSSGIPLKLLSLETQTWDELSQTLETLTSKTPLIILSAYKDSQNSGKSFDESLTWLLTKTQAPLFHMWEHGIGSGVLGGKIVSHYQQGKIAGTLALSILNGTQVKDIPVVDPQIVNQYIFDHKKLEQYEIAKTDLPLGSTVINEPHSIWDEYLLEATVAVIVLVLLLVFAILTLLYSIKLNKTQKTERLYQVQFQSIFSNAASGIALLDTNGQFVKVNEKLCAILGYSQEEFLSLSRNSITHPDDLKEDEQKMAQLINGEVESFDREKRLITSNGETVWVAVSVSAITDKSDNITHTIAIVEDISKYKTDKSIMEFRSALMNASTDLSVRQMLVRALDYAETMTGSCIGFFHFVNEKSNKLTLQAWSTKTSSQFCEVEDKRGEDYPIEKAGVWMECYRKRAPVVHNDYASLPNRKGMPEGHAPLIREIVIPVIRHGEVVAVMGVGNKESDYTTSDVDAVSSLIDIIWDIIEQKKGYEKLKLSEMKFSTVFNTAPAMMTLSNISDGKYIDANDRYLEVTGFKKEDVIGKTSVELGFITAEQREDMVKVLKQNGSVRDYPLSLTGANKQKIECIYNGMIIQISQSSYLLSLARDITHQVEADKRVEETQKRYQQLFDAGGDAIFVHPYNPDAVESFTEVNQAACVLLGFSQEELLKLSFTDITSADPQTLANGESARNELIQTRQALYESKYSPKMGPPIPVEVSCRIIDIGNREYILSIARNITARKAAEAERSRLAQDYQGLFNKMLEGFAVHEIICDDFGTPIDYRFLAVNPAFEKLTELSAANVVGKTILEILPNVERTWIEQYGKVALSGEPVVFSQHSRELGKDFLVTAFQNTQNQFACIFTDITTQKNAERQMLEAKNLAERANTIKSDFMANMSHEIRTPLNGISGMLQLLNTTSLTNDQTEYVHAAAISAKRLTKLLCDILDHSRIETGHLNIEEAPFDFRDVKDHLYDLFQVTAKEKGLDYNLTIDDDIPTTLIGDENRLSQVFGNILGNAFKFTTEGSISLSIHRIESPHPPCRILIKIQDTGIGIPEEKIGFLFSPFTQISSGYSRHFEGAGLGLSICKDLVRLMGGGICLSSKEGEGTTTYINLPFKEAIATHSNPEPLLVHQLPSFYDKRILVVEDDKINSYAIQKVLEGTKATVSCVENGVKALEQLSKEQFDLVLMDIQMPEMDGVETTKAIRNGKAGQNNIAIPVVALTAYATAEDRDHFLASGMNDYLSKPFEQDKLFNILLKLLRIDN